MRWDAELLWLGGVYGRSWGGRPRPSADAVALPLAPHPDITDLSSSSRALLIKAVRQRADDQPSIKPRCVYRAPSSETGFQTKARKVI